MSNLSAPWIAVIIILFVSIFVISNNVLAHAPSDMVLDYDFFDQQLNVTLTHDVADPNTHYIERVDILKNDVLYLTTNYTSQPSASTFTYTYGVEAADNDHIEVTATSSDTGSLTGQITVNEPSQDGVITSNEYEFTATFSDGEFKLHWKVTGDTILMAMEGRTTGWVAIGIEPTSQMKDADMIFGWVTDSGSAEIRDCFSTGALGPHPPDTEIGGTSDIISFGGLENGGSTVIEFKRLLTTGDDRDQAISMTGDVKVIWAMGSSDDFEAQHSQRGAGTVNVGEGTFSEIDIPSLWILHAALMIIGYSMMLIGMILARFFKKKKWWLKRHKLLGILGAVLSVAGLVMAFVMVSMSSGEHFRVPHAYVGVTAIIFAVMTPNLGIAQFKVKKNKATIRKFHRWFGRITLVVMIINIVIGINLV